ncbi:hypothetical protein [Prosthecobacter sp.]|uniref:immunity protein Imm33 domain-containing protein n=1 Tax=Prosthecobacter sp. TaxID=1965333 RepID=UPI0037831519
MEKSIQQQDICHQYGAELTPPTAGSRVGIALQSLHQSPVYGVRLKPENGTNGWYVWAGEKSDDEDFFQPVCVEHLLEVCPLAWPFLSLPPGWKFLTDGDYIDVWHDASLLEVA